MPRIRQAAYGFGGDRSNGLTYTWEAGTIGEEKAKLWGQVWNCEFTIPRPDPRATPSPHVRRASCRFGLLVLAGIVQPGGPGRARRRARILCPGARGPGRPERRPAILQGSPGRGPASSRRRRLEPRSRGAGLAAPGREPEGLPQPLPLDHGHEGGSGERPGRSSTSTRSKAAPKGSWPCPGSRPSATRPIRTGWRPCSPPSDATAYSSMSSAIGGGSRRRRISPSSTWRDRWACARWPRTASATRRRGAARSST